MKKVLLITLISIGMLQLVDNQAFSEDIGCYEALQNHCAELYQPDNMGNLSLGVINSDVFGQVDTSLWLGDTDNDFVYGTYHFYQALELAKDRLPSDFLIELKKRGYFRKLRKVLKTLPVAEQDLKTRIKDNALYDRWGNAWDQAIYAFIMKKMEQAFPGYSRLLSSELTPEMKRAHEYIVGNLNASIYTPIWKEHPHWQQIELLFEIVQAEYLHLIAELDLPERVKNTWSEKIASVRLEIPASDPSTAGTDIACAKNDKNASYSGDRNVMRVCAGYFNGFFPLIAVAHELGHAIDFNILQHDFQQDTLFAQEFKDLYDQTCSDQKPSCEDWQNYKESLPELYESIAGFEHGAESVLSCLQSKDITEEPTQEWIERQAYINAQSRIDNTAGDSVFLLITKPTQINPKGLEFENPYYLNPCGNPAFPDQYQYGLGRAMFAYFINEYRCNLEESDAERLRQSIAATQSLIKNERIAFLSQKVRFSSDKSMQRWGYSENTGEQFSDFLGLTVAANILARESSLENRWKLFLSSSSIRCDAPGIRQYYPEEAVVEHSFTTRAHSIGEKRRKEFLPAPIREALQCEKDFEMNECSL